LHSPDCRRKYLRRVEENAAKRGGDAELADHVKCDDKHREVGPRGCPGEDKRKITLTYVIVMTR